MTEQSASLVEHMPIGQTHLRGLRPAPHCEFLPTHIPEHWDGHQIIHSWMSWTGKGAPRFHFLLFWYTTPNLRNLC